MEQQQQQQQFTPGQDPTGVPGQIPIPTAVAVNGFPAQSHVQAQQVHHVPMAPPVMPGNSGNNPPMMMQNGGMGYANPHGNFARPSTMQVAPMQLVANRSQPQYQGQQQILISPYYRYNLFECWDHVAVRACFDCFWPSLIPQIEARSGLHHSAESFSNSRRQWIFLVILNISLSFLEQMPDYLPLPWEAPSPGNFFSIGSLIVVIRNIVNLIIIWKVFNLRKLQQRNLRINGSSGDCCYVCCCTKCALIQMAREVNIGHISPQEAMLPDQRVGVHVV